MKRLDSILLPLVRDTRKAVVQRFRLENWRSWRVPRKRAKQPGHLTGGKPGKTGRTQRRARTK